MIVSSLVARNMKGRGEECLPFGLAEPREDGCEDKQHCGEELDERGGRARKKRGC